MSKGPLLRAAVVIAATVAVPLIAATPALAYPPGTDPVLTTAAGGYATGDPITATISNVAPTCTVEFSVAGSDGVATTSTAQSGKSGSAAATLPGQTAAGSYTITAHGVASATNPDCATADVATTVVVSGKGGNPGSTASPSATSTPIASGQESGIFGNPRVRNAAIIGGVVVLGALGFWLFRLMGIRRAAEAAAAGVPPKH